MWLNKDGVKELDSSLSSTTVKYVSGLTSAARHEYLERLVTHNLAALHLQISLAGAEPQCLRMWRIGSDLLPLYTHPIAQDFYCGTMETHIDRALHAIGIMSRRLDVRLSFHPGQFVVLASQNPAIRENSMRELQYHCDVFTRMGYTGWHDHGVCVNVHVGVKNAAVQAMRTAIVRAPSNVGNFITLENDEFSWGSRSTVDHFGDLVAHVLDVHHYWIHEGVRLQPQDPLVKDIRATWRGVQPKLHLAMSREELCKGVDNPKLVLSELLERGETRASLRAHSDTPWHAHSVRYARQFGWDIMWEGKDKNLGAQRIAQELKLIQNRKIT